MQPLRDDSYSWKEGGSSIKNTSEGVMNIEQEQRRKVYWSPWTGSHSPSTITNIVLPWILLHGSLSWVLAASMNDESHVPLWREREGKRRNEDEREIGGRFSMCCILPLCLVLPPFQITYRFGKLRYIIFVIYLDIVFI